MKKLLQFLLLTFCLASTIQLQATKPENMFLSVEEQIETARNEFVALYQATVQPVKPTQASPKQVLQEKQEPVQPEAAHAQAEPLATDILETQNLVQIEQPEEVVEEPKIPEFDPNNSKNMPILLGILQSQDANAQLLRKKLVHYLYLQFRAFVGSLKANESYEGQLLCTLHDIYKFKDQNTSTANAKIYPFRTIICQTMLSINFVNSSRFSYEGKKAKLAQFLDQAKREISKIREKYPNNSIHEDEIYQFLRVLQIHAVKKSCLKKVLLIAGVSVATLALISFLIWYKWPAIDARIDQFMKWIGAKASKTLDPSIEKIANLAQYLQAHPKLQQEIIRLNKSFERISQVMATENPAGKKTAMEHLADITNTLNTLILNTNSDRLLTLAARGLTMAEKEGDPDRTALAQVSNLVGGLIKLEAQLHPLAVAGLTLATHQIEKDEAAALMKVDGPGAAAEAQPKKSSIAETTELLNKARETIESVNLLVAKLDGPNISGILKSVTGNMPKGVLTWMLLKGAGIQPKTPEEMKLYDALVNLH